MSFRILCASALYSQDLLQFPNQKTQKKEIYSSRPSLMILAMMFEGCLVDIVLYLCSSKDNKEVVSQCFYPNLPNCDDIAIRAISILTVAHFDS